MTNQSEQLGFDALLDTAAQDNKRRKFEQETQHLPALASEAFAYHRQQIKEHHAAMLDNDFEAAIEIRKEAHLLALKLNNGEPGILAGETAPGCVLAAQCAASPGAVPLWGQNGRFEITLETADAPLIAQIDAKGMFGIGGASMPYVGFSARAVDPLRPFISETGYRSFLGCSVPPEKGLTVDGFVRKIIAAHVQQVLRGRLVSIDPRYFKT